MVDHERFMRMALEEAQAAADAGETPVGAVVVDPALGAGEAAVVARGRNRTRADRDPTAHAEVVALRAAALARGNHRLTGLHLYVTLEPCPMCAGALSHARIGRVVFAASDPKGGGVVHGARVFDHPQCHWRPAVEGGPLAEESAALLRAFFQARRKTSKGRPPEALREPGSTPGTLGTPGTPGVGP